MGTFFYVTPHLLASQFLLYKEIHFLNPVLHPIKSHIYRLGTSLSNSISNDNFSIGVICFDWGCWLGKNNLFESNVEGYRCFPIVKKPTDFCFVSVSQNISHYSSLYVDWYVLWGWELWRFCSVRWLRDKVVVLNSVAAFSC